MPMMSTHDDYTVSSIRVCVRVPACEATSSRLVVASVLMLVCRFELNTLFSWHEAENAAKSQGKRILCPMGTQTQ